VGGDSLGKVLEMTWRCTRIQSASREIVSIPNTMVAESVVQNYSAPTPRFGASIEVHIAPNETPKRAIKILYDALYSIQQALDPTVRLIGITDSSITCTCTYTVADYLQELGVREAVWLAIWNHLKYAGISMTTEGDEEPEPSSEEKDQTILREIEPFKPFSDEALQQMAQKLKRQIVAPEAVIIQQGDPGDSLFIITEGAVAVIVEPPEGKPIEVARLGVGIFFGEMALLIGEKRTATIKALATTHLFEITKELIAPLLEENPAMVEELAAILAKRKSETEAKQKSGSGSEKTDSLGKQFLRGIQRFFGMKQT